MAGTTVCAAHGGKAPQVRLAARRRLAGQDAARMLADVQVQPVDDPIIELQALAGEALALKSFFADRVAAIERTSSAEDRVGLDTLAQLKTINAAAVTVMRDARARQDLDAVLGASDRILSQLRDQGRLLASLSQPPQVQAELDLYLAALDRSERFLRDLAALGLDERRVRLAERQGELVADVLRASMAAVLVLVRESLAAGTFTPERLEQIEREEAPAIMRGKLLLALPSGHPRPSGSAEGERAKERQREHGATAPGRPADNTGDRSSQVSRSYEERTDVKVGSDG
ncbi:MAG: hypothetical protein WD739_10985 [Actinomycetota bacterium]